MPKLRHIHSFFYLFILFLGCHKICFFIFSLLMFCFKQHPFFSQILLRAFLLEKKFQLFYCHIHFLILRVSSLIVILLGIITSAKIFTDNAMKFKYLASVTVIFFFFFVAGLFLKKMLIFLKIR